MADQGEELPDQKEARTYRVNLDPESMLNNGLFSLFCYLRAVPIILPTFWVHIAFTLFLGLVTGCRFSFSGLGGQDPTVWVLRLSVGFAISGDKWGLKATR